MSNSYKYLDKENLYIDPTTGVLFNLLGIKDPNELLLVESIIVTKKLQELSENPIKINGIVSLFEIHNYLFNEIYSWAGQKRLVEISKDDKQFFPIKSFDSALKYIDTLILEYKSISKNNNIKLSEKLAEILDNINYLHPFREGNGRAQREFIRTLALEKKLILNLNPADNSNVYERYMKGTIESDLQTLKELIYELINNQ